MTVVRCQIRENNCRRIGNAVVMPNNNYFYDRLMSMPSLVMNGRPLKIREGKGHSKSRRRVKNNLMHFPVSKFKIGYPGAVSDRERVIDWKISESASSLLIGIGLDSVIQTSSDEDAVSQSLNPLGLQLTILSGIQSKFLWEKDFLDEDKNEWIRTINPSENNIFYESDDEASQVDDMRKASPGAFVRIKRSFITPIAICPQPPKKEASSRILKQYKRHIDRFIRVTFMDEDFGSILQERLRVIVAGRTYVFLVYSNSQSPSNVTDNENEMHRGNLQHQLQHPYPPTAEGIRLRIEDLSSIKVVDEHAARLGQAFSDTTPTNTIHVSQYGTIPDVERNGYCFSDGVGMISTTMAEGLRVTLGLKSTPSAFSNSFWWYEESACKMLRQGMDNRARILIPIGVCLIGAMDETNTHEEGEVFVQRVGKKSVHVMSASGPGDIRVLLTPRDVPALRHLVDEVVDQGAKCDQCIQLAQLHLSTAVDFIKTGIPARFPKGLGSSTSTSSQNNPSMANGNDNGNGFDLQGRLNKDINSLRKIFLERFFDEFDVSEDEVTGTGTEEMKEYLGKLLLGTTVPPLISFPWIIYDILCIILEEMGG
eukprot:gene1659-3210_t